MDERDEAPHLDGPRGVRGRGDRVWSCSGLRARAAHAGSSRRLRWVRAAPSPTRTSGLVLVSLASRASSSSRRLATTSALRELVTSLLREPRSRRALHHPTSALGAHVRVLRSMSLPSCPGRRSSRVVLPADTTLRPALHSTRASRPCPRASRRFRRCDRRHAPSRRRPPTTRLRLGRSLRRSAPSRAWPPRRATVRPRQPSRCLRCFVRPLRHLLRAFVPHRALQPSGRPRVSRHPQFVPPLPLLVPPRPRALRARPSGAENKSCPS